LGVRTDTSDLILVSDTYYVDVDDIEENPYQPRDNFDPEKLRGLAENIRRNGQLHPIVLRPGVKRRWQLVCGERRWRAVKLLGRVQIVAKIGKYTDLQSQEIALDENLQDESLTTHEESVAFQNLWGAYEREGIAMTFDLMAGKRGVSITYVRNRMEFTEDKMHPEVFALSKRHRNVITTCIHINKIQSAAQRERLIAAVDRRASYREIQILTDVTDTNIFSQLLEMVGKGNKLAAIEEKKRKLLEDKQHAADSYSYPDTETASQSQQFELTGSAPVSHGTPVTGNSTREANQELESALVRLSGSINTVSGWHKKSSPAARIKHAARIVELARQLEGLAEIP